MFNTYLALELFRAMICVIKIFQYSLVEIFFVALLTYMTDFIYYVSKLFYTACILTVYPRYIRTGRGTRLARAAVRKRGEWFQGNPLGSLIPGNLLLGAVQEKPGFQFIVN